MRIEEIPLELIDENPRQPRTGISDEQLEELVDSIKEHGLLQPMIGFKGLNGRYITIAGHRRKIAAERAGFQTIAMIVVPAVETSEGAVLALVENEIRENLHYLDVADAVVAILADCEGNRLQVRKRLNISDSNLTNHILIGQLPEKVKEAARLYKTAKTDLLVIQALKDEEIMKEAVVAIYKGRPLTEIVNRKNQERAAAQEKARPKPPTEPLRPERPESRVIKTADEDLDEEEAGRKPEVHEETQVADRNPAATPAFVAKPGVKPFEVRNTGYQQELLSREKKPEPVAFDRTRKLDSVSAPDTHEFKVTVNDPDRPGEKIEARISLSLALPEEGAPAGTIVEALLKVVALHGHDFGILNAVTGGEFEKREIGLIREMIRSRQGGWKGDVTYLQSTFPEGVPPKGFPVLELTGTIWNAIGGDHATFLNMLGILFSYADNPESFVERLQVKTKLLEDRLNGRKIEPIVDWKYEK